MLRSAKVFVIALVFTLAGCASNGLSSRSYLVTYDTVPMGANMIVGEKFMCETPCNRYYDIVTLAGASGTGVLLRGDVIFKWGSGAEITRTVEVTKELIRKYPDGLKITFERPSDDKDWSLDWEKHQRILKRLGEEQAILQARKAEDDRSAALWMQMIISGFSGYNQGV